jgi:hypothetical protein
MVLGIQKQSGESHGVITRVARELGIGSWAGRMTWRVQAVADLPGRGPGDMRGHDHRPPCLVVAAARFEQRRVERADPQLRDPQLDITGRGRQGSRATTVALVRARVGPLMELGSDRCRELRIDQVLHPAFHQPAEQISRVRVAQTRDKVGVHLRRDALIEFHEGVLRRGRHLVVTRRQAARNIPTAPARRCLSQILLVAPGPSTRWVGWGRRSPSGSSQGGGCHSRQVVAQGLVPQLGRQVRG